MLLLLLLSFFIQGQGSGVAVDVRLPMTDSLPVKDTVSRTLKEVHVEDAYRRSFRSTFAGADMLRATDIQALPAFLGETDVLRALRLLPGIQSVSEGNSGVYVRGGSAGHNLFLLDDMELLNPSHLMGLFSVFNPLTVGDLEVFKGNAPVHLQGRLASTILVNSAEPGPADQGFELSVGTLSSTLALKRTALDGRFSIVLGYRRSYLETLGWVASAFLDDSKNYFKNNAYSLEDYNGKMTFWLNARTKLSLSGYTGKDAFNYSEPGLQYNATTSWGNQGVSLKLDHESDGGRLFSSTFNYSNTYSGLMGVLLANSLKFKSFIEQYHWKNHWELKKGRHILQYGSDAFLQHAKPITMSMSYYTDVVEMNFDYSNTGIVAYVGDYYRSRNEKTLWYAGLRTSANGSLGTSSSLGHVWFNVSPVLSVSHFPESGKSVKASFSMNEQNIHLAALSSIPLPFDVWVPSTPRLHPETANQLTLGYYASGSIVDWSVEGYVKQMRHQLLFNIMTDNKNNRNMEDQFLSGKGFAYGFDLAAQKSWDIYSAKLRYTFARSFRTFPTIMEGGWFKDKYDRPHDFNLQLTAKPNKRLDFSVLWTFASGCNISLPSGRWWMSGWIMNDYDDYNAFRLPSYHRLDVSVNYHLVPRYFKESVLNFSIVNLYNRANPYFAYFKVFMDENRYNLQIKSYQISLFPILPSIGWRLKW